MTEKKNNTALKVLIGVLAVALIGLIIFTIKFYNEEKENTAILKKEKAAIENELNELIVKYDEAIAENQIMDQDLVNARHRINMLLDSVKEYEANLVLITRYRREIGNLKAEKERLFRVVDSLSARNRQMEMTIDSTQTELFEKTRLSDSLQLKNTDLSNKIDKASRLKISNLRAEGVIVRNSGKLVENDKTRRIDKIRTCFTITSNELADAGDKKIYVQVYNPENELVGDKIPVEHDGGIMVYSAESTVYYENNELDVCVLANALENKLIEGIYKAYVYNDATLIGTASFRLR